MEAVVGTSEGVAGRMCMTSSVNSIFEKWDGGTKGTFNAGSPMRIIIARRKFFDSYEMFRLWRTFRSIIEAHKDGRIARLLSTATVDYVAECVYRTRKRDLI